MARRGSTVQDTFRNEIPTNVENNFTVGLKTEFTGLNFPPNACTDTQNCVFEMTGDVIRRKGFDYELNYTFVNNNRTGKAISTYVWKNVGGDGNTQMVVEQIGGTLYFYNVSTSTVASPLSTQRLSTTIPISQYLTSGNANDPSITECQYADGNGYLFVFHKDLEPFYIQFSSGVFTSAIIPIQVRDFVGIVEAGVPTNQRPTALTNNHKYNLENQGWTSASGWTTTSSTLVNLGAPPVYPQTHTFTVAAGLPINPADPVTISVAFAAILGGGGVAYASGTGGGIVVSYTGTSLQISITSFNTPPQTAFATNWSFSLSAVANLIGTWQTALGNYPSNADIWWEFKNSSDVFSPGTTAINVPLSNAPAPSGHFLLNLFNQDRSAISGVSGITAVTTTTRPKTGAWFQGRVWYTGVDASQTVPGGSIYYSWTESIYFSQIALDYTQFGMCYQTDDPTDNRLFNILPSDGGVIVIQGAGSIYKLWPIQNGMLVFAANGIWFITGSTGIGFTATDYTITKISAVRINSNTSFVDVNGLPMFWNDEDLYMVAPAQQGLGMTVDPLGVGTILSFFNKIPRDSKRFARGAYDPINYIVTWIYRSTEESSVTDRYQFDSALNLNTFTKAFYPWTISTGTINGVQTPWVHSINYVAPPGGTTAPLPTFKFSASVPDGFGSYNVSFAEVNDPTFVDWDYVTETVGLSYDSYFITGFRLDGQGQRKFQPGYVYMYSRNDTPTSYSIQGLWDFANAANSNKWSTRQIITNNQPNFGMVFRRHKLRGHGYALQLKVESVDGQPFDIMGWSIWETQNTGT